MLGDSNIQVGAGRYFQHSGALRRIGAETAYWGGRAYIVTDAAVWRKAGQRVEESMRLADVSFCVNQYDGPSTQRSFDQIAREAKAYGASVVIGLGGGRVIDIAKGASDVADLRVITAPTSAATCAAYAILYVTYGEDGSVAYSQFLAREISAVLADLDYIVLDCPVRYLASGIADAMAKKPEFLFTMLRLGDEGQALHARLATLSAQLTWGLYEKTALQAIGDAKAGKVTPLLEDVICANLMVTGMISDLSTGGKQLAVAHNFYDAVCCLRPKVRASYLHGEIVGLAIPLQMAVNGAAREEIAAARELLSGMGIPVTLEQAGIESSAASIGELAAYTHRKTIPEDQTLYEKILEGFRVMQ